MIHLPLLVALQIHPIAITLNTPTLATGVNFYDTNRTMVIKARYYASMTARGRFVAVVLLPDAQGT